MNQKLKAAMARPLSLKRRAATLLLLAFVSFTAVWASAPVSDLNDCNGAPGAVHVRGWCFDPDVPSKSIYVHVYVYKDAGCTNLYRAYNVGLADESSQDVTNAYHIGGNHRFNRWVEVTTPGTYYVKTYALDGNGENANPEIFKGSTGGPFTVSVTAPYSITYDANSGTGAPDSQKKSYNITRKLSSTNPTRDRYAFVGWNTAADGSGQTYAAGADYTANASVTLYAQWSGTDEHGNYLISNEVDWNRFAMLVANGETFSGKTVKLANTISVKTKVGVVSGSARQKPFCGTFDGGNNTLDVDITDTENMATAPFCCIKDATVRNLIVMGTVNGSGYHAAAIVGFTEGTCLIKNCATTVTVNCASYAGGILGHGLSSNVTIDSCVFAGKIVGGDNAKGVLFGWGDNGGTKVLSNSLYVWQEGQDNTNLDLMKKYEGTVTVTNCYQTANVGSLGKTVLAEVPANSIARQYTIYNTHCYESCTVGGVKESYMLANGTTISVLPTVQFNGADVAPENYSVAYTRNGLATNSVAGHGDYTITVTGNKDKGYSGTWSQTFTVHETFTITYDANGGTGAPEAQTKIEGEDLTLSSDELTRNGYKFLGWNTSADGTGDSYAAGATYTANAPTTLYAQWQRDPSKWCDIALGNDIEHGHVELSTSSLMLGETVIVTVTPDAGYYVSSVTYSDGTESHTLTPVDGQYSFVVLSAGNIAVSATFAQYTYTIAYDANGGTGAPEAQTKVEGEELTLATAEPTREGYKFMGWDTKADGTGDSYAAGATYTANAATTLYARWARIYTIAYDANDGTGAPEAQQKIEGVVLELTTAEPTREGYIFKGWNTSANDTGDSYAAGATYTANAPATLYAQWQRDPSKWCDIALGNDIEHGHVELSTSSLMLGETVIITVTPDAGYYVTSVTYSDGTESHTLTPVDGQYSFVVLSAGNIAVSATFAQYTYTIAYDANGGTGAPAAQTKVEGEDLSISTSKPMREGYYFAGWNTAADGTGTNYAPGAIYSANATVTLYAQWSLGVPYLAYNTETKEFETKASPSSITTVTSSTTAMSSGWYVVTENVSVGSRIEVSGTVNLILCDGATLNASNGMHVKSGITLNVYAQDAGTGKLNSNFPQNDKAGIGGNNNESGGNITIHGGNISASSAAWAAGIGGGVNGGGGTFSIYGGTVVARGGWRGCAINGTLHFGHMKVFDDKNTPATAANRANICSSKYAKIVTCEEHIVSNGYCKYCGTPNYRKISKDLNIVNGCINCPNEQISSSIVNLEIIADDRYTINTATYNDGNEHEITPVDGVYSFLMPDADVIVSATFSLVPEIDENGDMLITSSDDWNLFATLVTNCKNFSGKTVKLANDITVSTMVGTSSNKFSGTFDGGGHTLTVNYNTTEQYTAPFRYTNNATIKDLNIAGTIESNQKFAASLIGSASGATNITNCTSTATITGTINGDGTHGGFVAISETNSSVTFSDCAFFGELLGPTATYNGGFLGYIRSGSTSYTNCLFAPTEITMGASNSCTFNRNNTPTCNGAYYTQTFGTVQGMQVYTEVHSELRKKVEVSGTEYYAACDISGVNDFYDFTGTVITPALSVKVEGSELSADDYTITIIHDGELTNEIKDRGEYTLTVTGNEAKGYYGTWSKTFKVCFGCDTDGNYIIADADDWNIFAAQVANGETFSGKTVKLTANVSVTTKVGVVSGSTRQKPFSGTFDGGNDTLTVDITDTSNQGTAPFCFIKNATIRNLTVTGTVKGNDYHAAAIVGFTEGTCLIKHCAATATVNCGSHAGGILGHGLNSNVTIDSCVFAGKIVGGSNAKGVLFGWGDNGGKKVISNSLYVQQDGQNTSNLDLGKRSGGSESYTNCYKTANVGNLGKTVLAEVPANSIAKQYTIYKTHFYESCTVGGVNDFYESTGSAITPALSVKFEGTELSADDYSVTFTHDGALANEVKDEGEYTMTVTGNEANGYCGTWSKTFKVCFGRDAEGNYIIANNNDWSFFASKITNGETFSGKTVKLASDEVTVTERVPSTFAGTFDGCGKTLTVNLSGGNEELAIFTTISNASIQNLHITGTIKFARHRPASIASYVAGTSTVKNCWSDVDIISNYTPSSLDWVDGGALIARVNNGCTLNMSDCRFTGTFVYLTNNHEGGGMVGWTQDANATANLTNCLYAPTSLTMTKENTKQLTYIFVSGNKRGILTNCFYNGVAANTTVLKKEGTRVFDEPQTTLCKKVTLFGTDYYAQCDVLGVEDYYCYNEGQTIELDTKVFAGSEVMPSEDYTLTMTYNGALATEVKERGEYVITITGNNGNEVFGTWSKTFHVVGLDHDADGNYIIANADDWNTFATMVANVESFSDKTVKLANSDITVTTMVGTEANPFCGTFDGGGNTLTFNYSTDADNAAPFQWIKNATIKNMTVTGEVTTSKMFAAGFVARAHGDNAIENCVSSVTIHASKNGDGTHGGFVGRIENDCKKFTFTDCLFNGSFDGQNTDNWCPFAAWSMGNGNTNFVFNDCLYAPTSVNVRNGNATIYRNGTPTLNGAYYTQALGTVQGSQVFTEVQTSLCKRVTLFGTDYYAACNISGLQTEYFCSEGKPVNVGLVVNCGGNELTETDYTVAYTCNGEAVDAVTKRGEYVMTIAGNEEAGCFGTATAHFTVLTDEDVFIVNYDLKDSWGDGWNGCAINVIEKTSATTVNTLTINNGKSASGELMLDAGTIYNLVWVKGSYPNETSWTFNDGEGDLLFSGAGGSISNGTIIYQLLTSARPRNLNVTEPETGDFVLNWQSYEGHHDSWDVAYKSDAAADFTVVEGVTSNPYTLENLPVATEYTFKVRGRKDGLTTKWSDEVKFTMCEAITLANNATNNGALIETNDGGLCNVTLADRTIYRDGDWNTLVLPFEVNLTDEDSPLYGATARTLASASLTNNGQTLTLNFDEPVTRLEAGVPYIIKWTEKCETDIVNPVFPYVTIDATDGTFCSDDHLVRFCGTYDLVTFDDENKDVLFLGSGNNLYYPDGKATTTIGACRAYFKIGNDEFEADASQLRSIVMDFGEESETVSIENLKLKNEEEIWFTLDGRRAKGNGRGMVVKTGSKRFVK